MLSYTPHDRICFYWTVCRQSKNRDGCCCCCIKLGDDYTEASCGKRNILQEFMDKYVARAMLSLPGKVRVLSLGAFYCWYIEL